MTAREEYKFGKNTFQNYMCRSPLVLSPFSGSGTPGMVSSCLVCHISMWSLQEPFQHIWRHVHTRSIIKYIKLLYDL